jgi:hypothetical protein
MLAHAEAMLIKTKRNLAPYVRLDRSVVSPLEVVFFAQRVSIKSYLDNSTARSVFQVIPAKVQMTFLTTLRPILSVVS